MKDEVVVDESNREFVENAMYATRLLLMYMFLLSHNRNMILRKTVNDWLQNSSEKVVSVDCPTSFHRLLVHQEVKKR